MKKLIISLFVILTAQVGSASNFISNGTFEEGIQGWITEMNEGNMLIETDDFDPLSGKQSMKVTILSSTGNHSVDDDWWKLKMRFRMPIFKGAKYKVSFKAYASDPAPVIGRFERFFPDYSSFAGNRFDIKTTPDTYSFITEAYPEVVGYGAFGFYFGHLEPGTEIWMDDITIEEVEPLSSGNICNGDFESDAANFSYWGKPLIYGWTKHMDGATVDYSIDETTPITGTKSIKIVGGAGTPASDGWKAQLIWMFSPIVGAKYQLEFKAKSTVDFVMTAEAIDDWENNSRDNLLFNFPFEIKAGEVKTYRSDITSTCKLYKNYYLAFWLALLPQNETVWLDDINFKQIDNSAEEGKLMVNDETVKIYGENGTAHIEVPYAATANVYNMNGQRVLDMNLPEGKTSLSLTSGNYVIQVVRDNTIVKSLSISTK